MKSIYGTSRMRVTPETFTTRELLRHGFSMNHDQRGELETLQAKVDFLESVIQRMLDLGPHQGSDLIYVTGNTHWIHHHTSAP